MKFPSSALRKLSPFRNLSILSLALAWSSLGSAQPTNAPPELPAAMRYPADPAALPGKGPVQRWDQFPKIWAERRSEFWRHRQQDQGAVVFLGDSITQGWSDLARDFPALKTANRGIGGDTTRGVLFRLKEDVLEARPAAVVLLIGVNDLGQGGKPEDAADNVRLILAALKESNLRMPIIVCKTMPSNKSMAKKIQTLNALVDDLVKGDPQFIRCDPWSLYANEDGTCKKEEFPDLLHPNRLGYEKWKGALEPIFTRLKIGGRKTE
jgi:lysophospholipase L1-like esterase